MTREIATSTGRIVETAEELARGTTDHEAERDPADDRDREPGQRVRQDEAPGDDREHGRAIGDERGRVVEQRLAFDEGHDHARCAEAAEDRGGGERVGRGHDGAQGEGSAQPSSGTIAWATIATITIVKITRPIDRRTIGARFARRSRIGVADRGAEQQRRQEDQEDQVRFERDGGRPGHERQGRGPRAPSGWGYGTPSRRASSYRIAIATRIARAPTRRSIGQ